MRESASSSETETEADVESDDETETVGENEDAAKRTIAESGIEEPGGDEEARRVLREQLKRSLSQRQESSSEPEPSILSPTIELSEDKTNKPAEGLGYPFNC